MTAEQESTPQPISKSQRKRDALALRKLGRTLVGLAEAELQKLPLPEPLAQAVRAARALSRSALQRQLKYIGRLLREMDAEPIGQALEQVLHGTGQADAEFHRLERWRDRLIAEGDSALEEFLTRFPTADRSHLRQLVRNARKERAQDRSPRAARALFRYLADLRPG